MATDTTVIAGKVILDTSGATPPVKDLNKELDKTDDKLKKVNKTAEETTKKTKESAGAFSSLNEKVKSLPGPLGQAGESVGALNKAFKVLLANPVVLVITAIVAALAFLYKSFTNTASGGEKMEQVLAGVKASAKAVADFIFDLGGAIIKFFSGDFKGALEQAGNAINNVVSNVVDAYNQTSKLTGKLQELHKEQLKNDLESAERQKKLSILREQATDESIPIEKRKAALKELQADAEQNAKDDIKLAKETADTKIALLSIGTDAAKKNQDEINKIRIEQINGETDNANELRRINKQVTAAEKEEQAERLQQQKDAAEKQKQLREQLEAYNTQLTKIRQQNAISIITDQYEKEKQLLENKIEDDKNALLKQFKDGKLTRAQFANLEIEQEKSADIQRKAITDKHNEDLKDAEEKFQKQLSDIRAKTQVEGIVDAREKERVQLEISHEQEIEQVLKDYADDADKKFQLKQAIDAKYKAQQDAIDEKHRIEDAQKALRDSQQHLGNVLNDPAAAFKEKQAAIDAEQKITEDAFNNKVLTEEQYNDEIAKLSAARMEIQKREQAEQQEAASATADLIGGIADAVGKNTAAGKALAIAAATIKALQAEVTIIAGLSEVGPFGFVAGIAAAAAVGVGLFNTIKQIESVEVPGQPKTSSSVPSPVSIAAPVAPVQSSTKLDADSINKIGQQHSTVRAVVLEQDNAAAANRAARLQGQSRLGG